MRSGVLAGFAEFLHENHVCAWFCTAFLRIGAVFHWKSALYGAFQAFIGQKIAHKSDFGAEIADFLSKSQFLPQSRTQWFGA